MSQLLTCSTCQKRLTLRDDLAGKRVKCPGCGTVLAVPGDDVVVTAAVADEPSAEPGGKPREKRRKRGGRGSGGGSRAPARPLFVFAGISFTPLITAVFVGGIAFLVGGIILLLTLTPVGSWLSSGPKVQVVDVYTAVNGLRYRDVGERALQSSTLALTIPGPRKILITRPNPAGDYLRIELNIPFTDVDAYFPGVTQRRWLRHGMVKLEGGGESLTPVFVQPENDGSRGFHLDYAAPNQGGGGDRLGLGREGKQREYSLDDYLGPKPEDWTHEGELKKGPNGLEFQGKGGMNVFIGLGADRLDGQENIGPLEGATGKKITPDRPDLVGEPEGFVHVRWDKRSDGYIVAEELEEPNQIGRKWSLTCIVPRPKNGAKELTLMVLNKPQKIKLP
jgi:hypothetical protein